MPEVLCLEFCVPLFWVPGLILVLTQSRGLLFQPWCLTAGHPCGSSRSVRRRAFWFQRRFCVHVRRACRRICVCFWKSQRESGGGMCGGGEGVRMWTVHCGADMKTGQCMKSPSMGACASIVPRTPSVIFIFRRPVRSQSGFDMGKGW